MFHVTYEVNQDNDIVTEPKVGCNICRCHEGSHVRCFHHGMAMFAVNTYLYFKGVWDRRQLQ